MPLVVSYTSRHAPQLSTVDRIYVHGGAMVRYGSSNAEKKTNLHVNVGGKRFASQSHVSFTDFGDWTVGTKMPDSYGDWGLTRTRTVTNASGDSLIANTTPYKIPGSGYQQIDAAQDFSLSDQSSNKYPMVESVFNINLYCSHR